jgi:hypothetical protein
MMKARKAKTTEPSLRELLSQNVLETLVADARVHITSVIEKLRERAPEKYAELAVRAMAAAEPKPEGFESCQSMDEIGRKLLKTVGVDEYAVTDDMIKAAIEANDVFIARLEAIRDAAQSELN